MSVFVVKTLTIFNLHCKMAKMTSIYTFKHNWKPFLTFIMCTFGEPGVPRNVMVVNGKLKKQKDFRHISFSIGVL